jgi:type II secretory pathway pseudopilin PulG
MGSLTVRTKDPDTRSARARLVARLAALPAAARARLQPERGSVLIEVMVGAVILAIATAAILDGLDGAQATGSRNKARSVAAALAEQDQERMRSMVVLDLVDMIGTPQTRTVTVRGVDYTVKSTATWAPDNGGVISCSNNTRTASNVRILSEVTAPATRGVVDEVSLVTPPAGTVAEGLGRAIVKVLDRTGAGTSGLTVNLSGTASYSAATNSLGCAVFSFIPVGNYTASVGGTGLVDWNGNLPATASLTVTEGGSVTVPLELDQKAEIRANFDTKVGANAAIAAKSQWLTILNSKLSVGQKTIEAVPNGTPNTLITAGNLFPFVDGYSAYAGQCPTNDPSQAPTNNSSALQQFTTAPNGIVTTPKVRVPAINVRVVSASGSAVNGARVFVTTADAGCTNTFPLQLSANVNGISGSLSEPGFPYGTYRICAQTSATAGPHGHADVYASGYDSRSTSTIANETSTNLVNDVVSNNNANGNTTSTTTNGAIRIRLNRNGLCH